VQANVAGYRAVIEAAKEFGRLFAGQIAAAGRINPATPLGRLFIFRAGVALFLAAPNTPATADQPSLSEVIGTIFPKGYNKSAPKYDSYASGTSGNGEPLPS